MVIYKVTNVINSKIYVGQEHNENSSYFGSGKLIKLAIKKYGKENFVKEILERCTDSIHLQERERFWIDKLRCIDKNIGYNIRQGGSVISAETIEKFKNRTKLVGDKNPMFNTSFYQKWIEQYGKEEADRRKKELYQNRNSSVLENLILKHGEQVGIQLWNDRNRKISENAKIRYKTSPNPMQGVSYYEKWVERYGKEEADMKMKLREEKRIASLKRNKMKDERIMPDHEDLEETIRISTEIMFETESTTFDGLNPMSVTIKKKVIPSNIIENVRVRKSSNDRSLF